MNESELVHPAPWTTQTDRRRRVVLLGNGRQPQVAAAVPHVEQLIEQHADLVLMDLASAADLTAINADFAIVLGGDGAMLHAANQLGLHQIPVLGVNLGRLGFLAALAPAELERVLPQVCRGECRIVNHLMLHCSLHRAGRAAARIGLNEVAVLGGPPFTLLDIDLYVDSVLATTYSCDGLIVSTPIGSTAHNLSAGGPILRKSMQAFVISPISPHTLTVRPVVDRADRIFEVEVRAPHEATSVVVDGQVLDTVLPHDRIRVQRAEPTFMMIEVGAQSYYRTLREKLGWGGHFRSGPG